MDNSNKNKFAEIMIGLADNFGGTVTPEGMRARFNALIEYDIKQIVAAGDALIKTREKTFPAMPMVAEFINAIKAHEAPQISAKSRAEIQAGIVLENLRHYGSRCQLELEDHIAAHLMSTRWQYQQWASTVLEKDLTWWKKEFVEAYQAYSERDNADLLALPSGKNINKLKELAMGITKNG